MNTFLGGIEFCEKCRLKKTRTNVVKYKGSPSSDIMFLGGSPDLLDDQKGTPFNGKIGKWVNAILDYLGLGLSEVYLTNAVKCCPITDNSGDKREPTPKEIKNCGSWLKEEIEVVNPNIIIIMGGTALEVFFRDNKLSTVAGKLLRGHTYLEEKGILLFGLLHPKVLVRNQSDYKPIFTKHLDELKDILENMKGVVKHEVAY